jgi:chromosomal replication initiation ATPase DnaA
MNLKLLSKAESAMEKMHETLYSLKETCMEEKFDSKRLDIEYIEAIRELNTGLRRAIKASNHEKQENRKAEKAKSITELEVKVCECAEISMEEFRSYSGRKREFVMARQVHMAMLMKVYGFSDTYAGNQHKKDRVTALHACKTVSELYNTNKAFVSLYEPVFDHCIEWDDSNFYNFMEEEAVKKNN